MSKASKEVSKAVPKVPGTLLQKTGLWQASRMPAGVSGLSSGFAALDRCLAGQGWPTSGVTELLHDQAGIGEIRLLTPALSSLSQQQGRWILWVNPPYIPYPPALENAGIVLSNIIVVRARNHRDLLWVLEKTLGSGNCSAVLAWPGKLNDKQIRRLQVASKAGRSWNLLFRPAAAARQASPAELRIMLYPRFAGASLHSGIDLKILKRRGGWATDRFSLTFQDQLNQANPDFSNLPVPTPSRLNPTDNLASLHAVAPYAYAHTNNFKLQ